MNFTEISMKIDKKTAYVRKSWKVSKTDALGFQLFFAQKSIRLRFKRLHVNHLNKKRWYYRVWCIEVSYKTVSLLIWQSLHLCIIVPAFSLK